MLKRLPTLIVIMRAIGFTVAACTESSTDAGLPSIATPEESLPVDGAAFPHHDDGTEGAAKLHDDEAAEGEHHAVEPIGNHNEEHGSAVVPEAREVTLIAREWEFAPGLSMPKLASPSPSCWSTKGW